MSSGTRRILVVDDNRMERVKLSRALEAHGHEITTADGGALALEQLRAGTFDLVFLDLVMPGMDGYEVLRRIKADEGMRDTPVVVVSGLDDAGSVQACINLGARAHLSKPVSTQDLERCIEDCLGNPPSPGSRS